MEPIQLGSLTVYPYGLAVALAAAIGLLWMGANGKKMGLKNGAVSIFAVLAVPLGTILSHVVYSLIRFDWLTEKGFDHIVCLTDGGFTLYGTMLGCSLAALIAARCSKVSLGKLLDAAAAPAALTIALCRLAEGLVGQGYGRYLSDWFDGESGMSVFALEDTSFLEHFPFAVEDMYEEWCWAVFVLEAVFALVIMLVLLKTKTQRSGNKIALLLLLYAASQALCEGLREDAVLRWGFVRVNQILSAVVIAGVLLWSILRLPKKQRKLKQIILAWCGTLCGMLLVLAMEFAVEKKIVFLEWLPMDMCYLITALAGVLMVCCILPLWRKQDRA
jgi:phosphatidylglycerol---prolipoprotein diacylglyceryl transferase